MNFSLEATLDSRKPFTIDLLGTPSAVVRELTGNIRLVVQKPVQLKQITASFIGQAYINALIGSKLVVRSEPINIDRTEQPLLQTPTLYQPGEHNFPFQLNIPTDIVTTDTARIPPHNLVLEYFLIATAQPTGLLSRKKEWRQKLTIRRVQVEQSSSANCLYGAKRQGKIECSMYAPKFIPLGQDSVYLSVYMHAFNQEYRVQRIDAQLMQFHWIDMRSDSNAPENRGKRFLPPSDPLYSVASKWTGRSVETITGLYHTTSVSGLYETMNPLPDCSTAWGRESPIELVLKIEPEHLQPSEVLKWMKLVHVVLFRIHFVDENINPMVVRTPLVVGRVVDGSWTDHVIWQTDASDVDESHQLQMQQERDSVEQAELERRSRSELPEYGQDVADTTLLDSNTHRVNNAMLFRELYPERGELVVPDVQEDQPPVYEREEEEMSEPLAAKS